MPRGLLCELTERIVTVPPAERSLFFERIAAEASAAAVDEKQHKVLDRLGGR